MSKKANDNAHTTTVAEDRQRSSDAEMKRMGDSRQNNNTCYYILGLFPLPKWLLSVLSLLLFGYTATIYSEKAMDIRMFAIREFGKVIHEFDPWFNFRATQYLSKHGWEKFFHWYDYMSWYPLGRPVGTTIYPGLQITGVAIHRGLKFLDGYKEDVPMIKDYGLTSKSLNHVCCYIPVWFGAVASIMTGMLAWECSGSVGAGIASGFIMSVIPAHLMRSIGGGFDNESIGTTAIVLTFYFWVLSLRSKRSWPFAIAAGLAYGYMVAAWGGFIITLNILTAHAALLSTLDFLRGAYSERLYRSYTLFFIVGTFLATRVPVVSYQPFKSLEQLSALILFIILQFRHLTELQRRRCGAQTWSKKEVMLRCLGPLLALATMSSVVFVLYPTGYFGPLSSRVRGLFIAHTKTGNPLVDSVAEHSASSIEAYKQNLQGAYDYGMYGAALLPLLALRFNRWKAATFMLVYAGVTYTFSKKMSRLILLLAPVFSALAGTFLGGLFEIAIRQAFWEQTSVSDLFNGAEGSVNDVDAVHGSSVSAGEMNLRQKLEARFQPVVRRMMRQTQVVRLAVAIGLCISYQRQLQKEWKNFMDYAERFAEELSNPQLMWHVEHQGQKYLIDDYREGYWWLRDKTPKDSRVLAWWDYGYQITGIGERTSLADGNTWNHEHIATLGYLLTGSVPKSHVLIRHLADYVLVWGGQRKDDLGKSIHMARIGNSIYRNICKSATCDDFGFAGSYSHPTPLMKKSLLYNMIDETALKKLDSKYFTLAYKTKYGLMSIFKVNNVSQESKEWLANPANRKCDAPGSWYCEGQYPPVPEIQELIARRISFGQLEDFNKKGKDDAYVKEYLEGLNKNKEQ